MDLLFIIISTLLLVPAVIFGDGPVRIALGLPFVLFFPGYTLIAALFPRKADLEGIERLALSFGVSIAVVPLIGLILNYTPWGIRLYPILFSLTTFILAMSGIAWRRRQALFPQERFEVKFSFLDVSQLCHSQGRLDRALTVLLIVAILASIVTLAYVIAKPKVGERFTEFYILGPGGKAEGYPRKLMVGEQATIIVGVVNHEHETTSYRVKVVGSGKELLSLGPFVLEHERKWEQAIAFSLKKAGKDQKVEFLLFKERSEEPYRALHLWVDVTEAPIKGKLLLINVWACLIIPPLSGSWGIPIGVCLSNSCAQL